MDGTITTIIGILLLVMALFLIVSILMQSGKSKKLSGTIAGGAETFFGKEKGQAINKRLSMITNVVAVLFVVLVLALFLINAKQIADNNREEASTEASADASKDDASKGDSSKDSASKDEGSKDASKDASADASKDASADASKDASADASADVSEDASAEASKAA